MADQRLPADAELWSRIRDQAHQEGLTPHAVIRREAEEHYRSEHEEIEKDIAEHDRAELEEAKPLERAALRMELDWERTELRYNLDLRVRQRAADVEKVFLKEELAELGPQARQDAVVAESAAALQMTEDVELWGRHTFDLMMMAEEKFHGYHDDATAGGVRALQFLELENLKDRHHAEISRLSREVAQEKGGTRRLSWQERMEALRRSENERESDRDKGRER